MAGYRGGWVDTIIMRYIDLQWAFPNFIIAVYLVAVFGTGLLNVIIAITPGLPGRLCPRRAGMVLTLREQEFVLAARAIGASDSRIQCAPHPAQHHGADHRAGDRQRLLRDPGRGRALLPGPGRGTCHADLGADPERRAQSFISRAWWLAVFPGLAITLTVLSINFLGDALRDILDVRDQSREEAPH